jgi:phosphoglycerate dehydrogenase-like enzyme
MGEQNQKISGCGFSDAGWPPIEFGMEPMKIYSDTPFQTAAMDLLKSGVVGHELVFPRKMAASVLGQSEAGPEFDTADIAFGQPLVECVLRSERLRWLHLSTAGYTRYDTPAFRDEMVRRGIVVTNSSSVYAEACVEHVMAFMLAQSRQLVANLASHCGNGSDEWFGLRESAVPLCNQRVVILGYGTIAARLVEVLSPFRMQVVAVRRRPRGDEAIEVITPDQLENALSAADHVINILPDNQESERFVDLQKLKWIKPGAVFYNIGRGKTVDQDALAEVLSSGHLGAAWLDVTDPEPLPENHILRSLRNCYITPHTAGGHRAESSTLVRHFLANLERFQTGMPLLDRIM